MPTIILDDTIRTCLGRIARCQIVAVGVLADYLEETGHPFAGRVRRMWNRYLRRQAFWYAHDFSRSRSTRGKCLPEHTRGARRVHRA